MYKKSKRNYEGVQFGELRKRMEKPHTDAHDELSAAYYEKRPYKDRGILDKETFDKLHGLIELKRQVDFHEENMKLKASERIPLNLYNSGDIEGIKKQAKNIEKDLESK